MSWTQGGGNTATLKENPGAGGQPKSKGKFPWKVLIITVFLLLAMMVLSLVSFEIAFGKRVAPGVKIASLDVGGLQKEDAMDGLAASFNSYLKNQLVLKYEASEWRVSASELRVEYDAGASFDEAFDVGKDGTTLQKVVAYGLTMKDGKTITPVFDLDDTKLRAYVAKLAIEVDKDPVNAGLQFDGLQLKTLPAQTGLKLDQEGTVATIKTRLSALSIEPVSLKVSAVTPAIVEFSLDQAKAEAEKLVDAPIKIQFQDKSWTIDRPTIASMVTFREVTGPDGQRRVTLDLDADKIQAYANKLAKEIERPSRKARFKYENGKLTTILGSQDGRALDRAKFSDLLKEVVKKPGDRLVSLPVTVTKPTVTEQDIAKIIIRDKLDERSTSYAGSIPERAHNVELGASRLNGVVIAPGEIFSFNTEVGGVTGENGYQLGFAIIGSETVPDPGGGICQVSTTVFQTAFWSGLQITERHAHSYRMRRYEPPAGLDATVYDPQLDFRFKNDTDNYILMQSWTADSRVYFAFYGVKSNRTVTVEGPVLTNVVKADPTVLKRYTTALVKGREVWAESAEDGVDVSLTRIVKKDGKELSRDTFKSSYRPERNVLLIGTGE